MTAMAAKNGTKSEFALLQTSSLLFRLVQFVKFWPIFLELNSKRLYLSWATEKLKSFSCIHVLYKRFIWEVSNVPKKAWCACKVVVLPIQTYCFFCRSRCHSRCLSFLLLILKWTTRKSYFYVNSFILVTGRAEILSSLGTLEGLVSRVEGNAPCFETFIVQFLLP